MIRNKYQDLKITEQEVLLHTRGAFDECKFIDNGSAVSVNLTGLSRVKYGVSFTIEKNEQHLMPQRALKAANSVKMCGDMVV